MKELKHFFLFSCLIFLAQFGQSQTPFSSKTDTSLLAFQLFNNNKIKQTVSLLKNHKNESVGSDYLEKMSNFIEKEDSIHLNDMLGFEQQSTAHFYSNFSNYYASRYFLNNSLDSLSRAHLDNVDSEKLLERDYPNFCFMKGYFALQDKNYAKASKYFSIAKNNGMTGDKLNYYQAFSYHYQGDTANASRLFENLIENEKYGLVARYFMAEMSYQREEYQKVIEIGEQHVSDEKEMINAAYEQLIGESYIRLDNLEKGASHLEKAINLYPEKAPADLYYQTAIAKLQAGDEDKAIDYFLKASIGTSEYSVLSAFQLEKIYLEKKDYQKALSAFENCIPSENKKIQEEAIYQSAKIHAHLAQYEPALRYCGDYLNKYSKGKWKTEIQNLKADLYLRTSDYDLAINYLDKLGDLTSTQKAIYQKVAFLKAQLLFNDGDFSSAIRWFNKSNRHPKNTALVNAANYHLGEAYLVLKKYDQAIQYYKRQSEPNSLTHYGLGYAYYNKRKYDVASEFFYLSSKNIPEKYRNDASLRYADCLYALKRYDEAIDAYQLVDENYQKDYISYQKAVILGSQNSIGLAVSELNNVASDSYLYPKAILLKADLYFEDANFERAKNAYDKLIKQNKTPEILAKSYLNRAICASNTGDLKSAEKDYKSVVKKFPTSKQAVNAILGLQELAQKGIKVRGLDEIRREYKAKNPKSSSLEVVDYEAAKSKYFSQKYSDAIIALENYEKEYPNSSNLGEASYFLADAYYRVEDYPNAQKAFEKIKKQRSRYTGRILNRLGEVSFLLGDNKKALQAFNQLKQLNLSVKDNYFAYNGKMLVFYKQKDYQKTIEISNKILNAEWKPINAMQTATLYKGKSYYQLNSYSKATETFKTISDEADIYAAEANYYIALIAYDKDNYDQSLELLFALNSKYGSYSKWIDQSYLLIAKNYLAKNELFQAQATLKSIVEHTKDKDVKTTAQKMLEKMEKEQAPAKSSSDSLNIENENK